MLTTMQIMSASGVVAYFGRELSTSEYYTAEHGVWCGERGRASGFAKRAHQGGFRGRVDPHWHCHALLFNATYDETEGRWKAAQLGNVIANKGFYLRKTSESIFRNRSRLRIGCKTPW